MAPPEATVAAVAAAVSEANARRADDVVAALVRHGVDLVFVCPGSRSTPLVLALERRDVRSVILLDERVAGFAALGAGRVGQRAAVLTTSGTAVANLLPACAEAARDGVPLVCLTADRSAVDVARGASQSLDQPPLLRGVARAVVDLPAPDASDPVDVTPLLDDALTALAGPVHLNVRFDKPLEPPAGWRASSLSSSPSSSSPSSPSSPSKPTPTAAPALDLPAGVVVVGALNRSLRGPVARLLARLGWPAIVDVASGVAVPTGVPRLPTVALRSAVVREALAPRGVLWLGGLMTEDHTATWVGGQRQRGSRVIQLDGVDVARDPFGLMDERHVVTPDGIDDLGVGWPAPDAGLVARVQQIAGAVDDVLATTVGTAGLDEPAVARLVAGALTPGMTCFIGNSMPIRDVDRFGPPLPGDVELLVNRGVAGIDGNLATALGASLASGRPGLVLLGDLAALHDLSGLAAVAVASAPLRIIVINNDGGGIFSFLPVGAAVAAATHERAWGTPHGLALSPVASALGLTSTVIDDVASLRTRLAAPITGPELLEVRTSRVDNVVVHRALDRAVEEACAGALVP